MLQLTKPLSHDESEMLLRCLSEMEDSLRNKSSRSNQSPLKRTALLSAKKKVEAQVYDGFHREEIANMVFALDTLSRRCCAQLTENTPADEAASIGSALRTAAVARAKLRKTIAVD